MYLVVADQLARVGVIGPGGGARARAVDVCVVVVGSPWRRVTETRVETCAWPRLLFQTRRGVTFAHHGHGAGGGGPVVEESSSGDRHSYGAQPSAGGGGGLGIGGGAGEGGSTLAGSTGREMYWYISQAVLGLGDRASVSKAWSGTW